jgi:hypothetical protein
MVHREGQDAVSDDEPLGELLDRQGRRQAGRRTQGGGGGGGLLISLPGGVMRVTDDLDDFVR